MKLFKNQWKIQYSFFQNPLLLILLILSCITYTILEVAFSEKIGNSLDVALTGNVNLFSKYLKSIIIITIIFLLIRFVYCYFECIYVRLTLKAMKQRALEKISSKSLAEYYVHGENVYKSFFVNDMNLLENSYILPVINALSGIISLIITLIALVRINWIASIFVLVVSFLPLLLTKLMIQSVQNEFGNYAKDMEQYSVHMDEYLDGYQEFNNYGAADQVIIKHEGYSKTLENSKRKAYLKLDIMSNTIAISSISVTIGILLVGMFLALHGLLTVGEVFAISFISNGVSVPLSNLSDYIPKILSVKKVKNKYNEFVKVNKDNDCMQMNQDIHSIDVKNVTIEIEERKIINDISITFEKGKKYVLIGESGSGKSTLLKLIAGLFEASQGTVEVNHIPIESIDKNSLFNVINYVPQQGVILEDTIRNNVAVYRDDVKDEMILDSIETVGFMQRFKEFQHGLDEEIINQGSELSGGEKQRLSLARALVKKNNVLFLDEATSALDHNSYLDVERVIANLDLSILVSVEHRLEKEILEKYDEIVAMREGKIIERGRFEELMNSKGFFYSLYEKQLTEG